MARISKGRVTTEIYETEEQLTKVRNQFLSVFERLRGRDNVKIVNAAGSIEEIHERICQIVDELYQ